jgi:hypothetical protein
MVVLHTRNISFIALLISILSACYTIYHNEIGTLFAEPNISLSASEKISIKNELGGVGFKTSFEMFNAGKKEGRISKIDGTLSLSNSFLKDIKTCIIQANGNNHSNSPRTISIKPNESWSGNISFCFPLTEKEHGKRTDMNFRMGKEINEQYLGVKDKTTVYSISDKLLKSILETMDSNMKEIEHGEYTLSLFFWEDPKKEKLVFQKSYTFRLTEIMVKGLRTYQAESYRIPPGYGSMHISYYATPSLNPI